MGYIHIPNLYKEQYILLFKECYALEKIHGTSARLIWDNKRKLVRFFSGEKYERFVSLFDIKFLTELFTELFPDKKVVIHGEFYGGDIQGMSKTYGDISKFIGFDVRIDANWLNVPNAEQVCKTFNVEFVDYVKVSTDLEVLNFERDKDSVQAIRNGCGPGKKREGVVLKPLEELTRNNGERIINKHKRAEFCETKTQKEVTPEKLQVLTEANEIADEWVTEMRFSHVISKLPENLSIKDMRKVIDAMIEDVYREGKDEIVENAEVARCIGNKTMILFKKYLVKTTN